MKWTPHIGYCIFQRWHFPFSAIKTDQYLSLTQSSAILLNQLITIRDAEQIIATINMEDHQEKLDPRQAKAQKIYMDISKSHALDSNSYFFRNLLHDGRRECLDKCVRDYKGNNVSRMEKSCLSHCLEARMYTAGSSLFTMYLSTAYSRLLSSDEEPKELSSERVEFFAGNR